MAGPDDELLEEALGDLLLGGGGYKNRRAIITQVDLDRHGPLYGAIRARLDELEPDRDRRADQLIAWELLVAALRADSRAPEADRGLLRAGAHMLGRGRDPRDASRLAPYNDTAELIRSVGTTLAEYRQRTNLEPTARYTKSVTLRRWYSARASGLGVTVDTLRPDKPTQSRYVGAAALRALRRVLADDAAVRQMINAHASPDAPSDDATPAEVEEAASRPTRRKAVWLSAAALVGVLLVVAAGWWVASRADPGVGGVAASAAEIAEVTSVEDESPMWTLSTRIWVPVDAPLEDVLTADGGCGNEDTQEWLFEHGSFAENYLFLVRNTSDGTIGLSNVVARGTDAPAQPGLVVTCIDGGTGGEVEWSELKIDLADGAVAEFAGDRISNYFSRSVESGDSAGIMVSPKGERDFKGTLTIDAAPASGTSMQLGVPAIGTSEALSVDWHGMPADKQVVVSLSRQAPPLCTVNGEPLEPCSADKLRRAVEELWGQ